MSKERLFKCLLRGRVAPYSHKKWPQVGRWLMAEGELKVCENGIHLCREQDLVYWLRPVIYEAEYRGDERIDADTKIVVREARLTKRLKTWNARTARLFACDCAEHVLLIYESQYPNDDRPRQAIETARRYACGKATRQELVTAWAAARSAEAAAWAAADLDAASAAADWDAARAGAAAGAAADWDAARAAAWAAAGAGAAERQWQTQRLMEYLYPGDDQFQQSLKEEDK